MDWDCISIDPPWNERGGGEIKRGADRHYPLIKTKQMPAVIRRSGVFTPAENCHMYMWVTKNFLRDGLWLMAELGFEYKTSITWVKTRKSYDWSSGDPLPALGASPHLVMEQLIANGIGQYFRGATEFILFGVRGRGFTLRSAARNLPDVIFAPPGAHSEKPEKARLLMEARTVHPTRETRRLEMFARTRSSGWECWGNEIDTDTGS